jgi:hypothetical protein
MGFGLPRGAQAVKILGVLLALASGCAPRPTAPEAAIRRWIPIEAPVTRVAYPAGDGAVSAGERVLILVPSTDLGRRPPPMLDLPERVGVGEMFRVVVRVPRADERDRRTFRLTCARPGLRLLDGDIVETIGRRPSERRAIADSAGPTRFEIEEIGD